jgi:hypothetical protein
MVFAPFYKHFSPIICIFSIFCTCIQRSMLNLSPDVSVIRNKKGMIRRIITYILEMVEKSSGFFLTDKMNWMTLIASIFKKLSYGLDQF